MLGPVVYVCDRHAGILRPQVAVSLSGLKRGMPWPEPKGVIHLELNLVAC